MQSIIQHHIPIHLTYKDVTQILFVASHDNCLYINVNSIYSEINKWKRGANVKDMISELNKRSPSFKSYFSIKNQGTWIILELFENFGNWLHRKDTNMAGFGTYTKNHLQELYTNYSNNDPYFKSFVHEDKRFILRANRDTNFINLTDILTAYGKDIKSWKKTRAYIEYVEKNPTYIISSNDSVDEFGIRTSYGHSDIARLLLKWLYTKNNNQHLIQTIEDFIKDEEETESSEEETESSEEETKSSEDIEQTVTKYQSSELKLSGIVVTAREDGFINATQLCKAGNKKFNNWKQLDSTLRLIQALESDTGIPASQLIDVHKGNTSKFSQGSWIHPDLAVQLAQWISPNFSIQVSRWVREIVLTGSVTLGKEKSSEKLDDELRKKIGMDVSSYGGQDVLYILSFVPVGEEYQIEDDEKKCYKFGVSGGVSNRLYNHERDKEFSSICVKNVFQCGNKKIASKLEKRVKKIRADLGIDLKYYNKLECFIATDSEYNILCESLQEYLDEINEEDKKEYKCIEDSNEVKLKTIEFEEKKSERRYEEKNVLYKLYENDKFSYDQLKEMICLIWIE